MIAQKSTIVGVFNDRLEADRAVDELRRSGFRDDQIGVAMRHDNGAVTADGGTVTDESHTGSGAVAGVLTGLGLGALAGLGVLSGMIPVIGPAIAGGTLGIILSNAAVGAGVGGLVGALVGAGIPEDEAHYYQGEFEAGRTIVTVHADDRAGDAMAIFRRHGAYDMSTRPDRDSTSMAASATKPIDIPVHSQDVMGSPVTGLDVDETTDIRNRGTGRTTL
jgi:hypothetical protein